MFRSLRFRTISPRYSLRTLLATTLVVALLVHFSVTVAEGRRLARRQHFVDDVRAQILVSQRIAPEYSVKLLNFVCRRISSQRDAGLISPDDQRTLLKEVERQRSAIHDSATAVVLLARDSQPTGSP